MWFLLPANESRPERLHLPGGIEADPKPVDVGGQARIGYHVADDAEGATALRRLRFPHLERVEDDGVAEIAVEPVRPKLTKAQEELNLRQRLYLEAQGLGWTGADLQGTWDGTDWTEADARSEQTGLTLLEMRQTRPPKDWEALRLEGAAPWESTDWVAPVPGWVAPAWTSKIPRPVENPADADPLSDPTATFDGVVDPDAETVVLADPVEASDQEPLSADGDEVWSYPPEQIARARDVIAAVVAKYPGAEVSRQRVNTSLRKEGLKILTTDDQLAWFLSNPDSARA